MKIINPSILESEHLKKLFDRFFNVIQISLEIKNKGGNSYAKIQAFLKKATLQVSFQTLFDNKNNIQFKHFAFFIESIKSLEKNQTYSDTVGWKILRWLNSRTENPIPTIEAIEYLDKEAGFLREDFFSVISMASVIYCLSVAKPISAAKMLVELNALNLLTEHNIGKIYAMEQSKSDFLPKIIHKLNLVEKNSTSRLLNQANLNKLLENCKLNLEILAEFIQVEDESKILTEEKFDLAMILKQLLTQENIQKIEKKAFAPTQLIKVLSLLDKNQLLNQEMLDHLLKLNNSNFEKIISVLNDMHKNLILTQENLLAFLDTLLKAEKYDALNAKFDSAMDQNGFKTKNLLTDKLCAFFTVFLSKVNRCAQVVFDKIIKKFNEMIGRVIEDKPVISKRSTNTPSSFFTATVSSNQELHTYEEKSFELLKYKIN